VLVPACHCPELASLSHYLHNLKPCPFYSLQLYFLPVTSLQSSTTTTPTHNITHFHLFAISQVTNSFHYSSSSSFSFNFYHPIFLSLTPISILHHSILDTTKRFHKASSFIAFALNGNPIQRRDTRNPVLSEGRDQDEALGPICPGCGIFMQDKDQNLPGFYQQRELKLEEDDYVFDEDEEEEDDDVGEEVKGSIDEFDELEAMLLGEENDDVDDELDLDGFKHAGVGYGNVTEEVLERAKKKKVSKAEKKRMAREAEKVKEEVTVCARCHSLRNYGQVKNNTAENLIPDFDFDRLISTRLMNPAGSGSSTVVVMVVDCVDFDGSFPRTAVKSLFKALEGIQENTKKGKRLPKLVLVATKVDLLPSQVSPTRLDRWVRHRASAGGAPKLSAVYLVSSRKDLGVKNLLSYVKTLAGPRGNVWVIGAQNAGKSTLINAFAKKEGAKVTKLTEAPVPGTTLGILRIGGILSAKAKMFDTPGLLHPYLMSMRLNREEQKMIEIRKELRPRSYRIKASYLLLPVILLLSCIDYTFICLLFACPLVNS
jgi:hypothetical protein